MSHVHCAACHKEVDSTPPARITLAQELLPVATATGISFVPRPVPLCQDCTKKLETEMNKKTSRLIVPNKDLP